MADRRNGGYHRIREDYEIRSKQEAKKIIKDKDHSKIESQSSNLLYSDNSADEWTGLDLSDDITISPSRLVIILLMLLLYTYFILIINTIL